MFYENCSSDNIVKTIEDFVLEMRSLCYEPNAITIDIFPYHNLEELTIQQERYFGERVLEIDNRKLIVKTYQGIPILKIDNEFIEVTVREKIVM